MMDDYLDVLRQVRSEMWQERKSDMGDSEAKQRELREALAELRRIEEEIENADVHPRVNGMADVHEIFHDSLRRCLDSIELVTEAQSETGKTDEKYSFAWGMLNTLREIFEDGYYEKIEKVKLEVSDDAQELG